MDDFANVKNFSLAEFLFWTAISAITFICKKGAVKDKNLDRFFDAILIVSPFTAVLNYYIHFSTASFYIYNIFYYSLLYR